jgi:hypothetical protein
MDADMSMTRWPKKAKMKFSRLACLAIPSATLMWSFAACPAIACITFEPPNLEDVKFADVVLIARFDKYRIVRDEAFRKEMLASPYLTSDEREIYKDPKEQLISDYALLDLQVERVLKGDVPARLSVTWDNSTFGEPDEMPIGSFLIALRREDSPSPPLRGPSATILPTPAGSEFTVLQAPCSGAFIFDAAGREAATIQRMLSKKHK